MSQQLPDVFKRLQDKKKEQRDLKAMYRDALSVNGQYAQVKEELEALKLKKKKMWTADCGDKTDEEEIMNFEFWIGDRISFLTYPSYPSYQR